MMPAGDMLLSLGTVEALRAIFGCGRGVFFSLPKLMYTFLIYSDLTERVEEGEEDFPSR